MAAESILSELAALAPERLLRRVLGWSETAGAVLHVRSGGRRYRLRPIAQRDGWTALLQEVRPTDAIPGYATRREISHRLTRRKPNALIVHTHPIQPVQVWQWIDRVPGRPGQYREHSVLGGSDTGVLCEKLRRLASQHRGRARHAVAEHALAAAIVAALRERIRRHRTRGPAGIGAAETVAGGVLASLQQGIERSDDPSVVRAVWRSLEEVAVLDPSCGRGDRLYGVLGILEVLRDACLERMQVWVDELAVSRIRTRPEKLADFRRVLARARDARRHPDPRHFIVASILRDNLYGIEADAAALRECERRLLAELGPSGKACQPLNLRHGRVAMGFSTAAELRQSPAVRPDTAARLQRLEEQAEAIHRAYRLLRDAEQRHDGDAAFTPLSRDEIDERLLSLRYELDTLKAAEHGILPGDRDAVQRWAAEHQPVHLWAEFFGMVNRGGFDLVLDDSNRSSTNRVRERASTFSPPPSTPPGTSSSPRTMSDPSIRIDAGTAAYPEVLERLLAEAAPASLFLRGNPALLRLPLLAVFCSIRVPGSIILRSLDAARELRDHGVATVGGFQSPLERECLGFLLRGSQPVVISPARGIEPMRLPAAWSAALAEQRLLLVSRFEGRKRRATTRMAEARNLLVGALADRVLIAYAAPGSRTYRLARTLLQWERPVFTWDEPHNADLMRLGVRAVTSVDECLPPGTGGRVPDPGARGISTG